MRCVVNKCTSFNHHPAEKRCCLAHGNPYYGAVFPNPHPETGHITYAGAVDWAGDVEYRGMAREEGDTNTKHFEF